MIKNLNFFNTLSNKKEKFVPINNSKLGMYVCGPTVYDFPHIGNASPLVVFDVLFRLLQNLYGGFFSSTDRHNFVPNLKMSCFATRHHYDTSPNRKNAEEQIKHERKSNGPVPLTRI